jgi:hypothetical protein
MYRRLDGSQGQADWCGESRLYGDLIPRLSRPWPRIWVQSKFFTQHTTRTRTEQTGEAVYSALVVTSKFRISNGTWSTMINIRGGQTDELRESHFMKQFRQDPCLYSSSQTYGSNTARCLRQRSLHFLLVAQENEARSGIQ